MKIDGLCSKKASRDSGRRFKLINPSSFSTILFLKKSSRCVQRLPVHNVCFSSKAMLATSALDAKRKASEAIAHACDLETEVKAMSASQVAKKDEVWWIKKSFSLIGCFENFVDRYVSPPPTTDSW
jgi:hypothetical protein